MCVGNFQPLMPINWIRQIKSESDLFLYTRNLSNERWKPVFELKITFWSCVLVMWIHKWYYVVKKLVLNVHIKAFWYTKMLKIKVTKATSFFSSNIFYLEVFRIIYIPSTLVQLTLFISGVEFIYLKVYIFILFSYAFH